MTSVNTDTRTGARARQPVPAAHAGRTRRLVARLSLLVMPLVASYALLIVFEMLTTSFRGRQLDFAPYYAAAVALRANLHANIYDQSVLTRAVGAHPGVGLWPGAAYLYPPLLAIILIPLTVLSYDAAYHVWMALNLALWAACSGLLGYWLHAVWTGAADIRPSSGAPGGPVLARLKLTAALRGDLDSYLPAMLLSVVLSFAAWPVLEGLLMGQVHLLVFFALLCVPLLVRRNHVLIAGFLLAFVTAIKLLPVVLILYFAARGRWRVVLSALAWLALLFAFMALVVGVPVLLDARMMLGGVAYRENWNGNQSIAAAPALLASAFGSHADASAAGAGRALTAFALAFFGFGLIWIWRIHHSHRRTIYTEGPAVADIELLEYGWAICGMVLLAPLVWIHYNTWLLFPLILCLGYMLQVRGWRTYPRWLPALLAVVYVMVFLPWSIAVDTMALQSGPHVAGVALVPMLLLLHPLSAAALWLFAGWTVWHCRGTIPAQSARSVDPEPEDPLGNAEARQVEAD